MHSVPSHSASKPHDSDYSRNRAKEHGIPCDIVERLGKGDPFCRVVLWKKKKD